MARRNRRAGSRSGDERSAEDSEEQRRRNAEQLFRLGLVDVCPRCGHDIASDSAPVDDNAASKHLEECNDEVRIAQHAERVRARNEVAAALASKSVSDEAAAAIAQWEFRGRQVGQLWMLPLEGVAALLRQEGLSDAVDGYDADTAKPELIKRLAAHFRSAKPLLLTSAGEAGERSESQRVDGHTMNQADHDELPKNLHAMDRLQLQAVAASYGIEYDSKMQKADLVCGLEGAQFQWDTSECALNRWGGSLGYQSPEAESDGSARKVGQTQREAEARRARRCRF
eukprot:NODE_2844_length_1107_cov_26.864839_g2608_i0.p1 GENE.NODE_2844_length_1107_cov_26.864839_g2608_i0~~NODE_2844_length_1107_cov_26.864839_g2608_i0.p1  ORF type:complete len:284 (-),score=43.84 NODE_2844_length_1107_cov_26.864839_g2608_i0:229-1080(-)